MVNPCRVPRLSAAAHVGWALAILLCAPFAADYVVGRFAVSRSRGPRRAVAPDCPCGVVAAAVASRCVGRPIALDDVRRNMLVDPLGRTSMLELLRALQRLGVPATPAKLDAASLRAAATPAVLFVDGSHFVTAIPAAGRRVVLIDPPTAPTLVGPRELGRIRRGEAVLIANDPQTLTGCLRRISLEPQTETQ